MEEKVLSGSISKEAQAAMIRKERTANNAWHKFCRNKSAVVGLVIVCLMILMGVLAPLLSPYDPNQINVLETYLPPFTGSHLLGTDDLGRDLLSRLLYGAQMSIVVAIGATVLGGVIGIQLAGLEGLCDDRLLHGGANLAQDVRAGILRPVNLLRGVGHPGANRRPLGLGGRLVGIDTHNQKMAVNGLAHRSIEIQILHWGILLLKSFVYLAST